MPEQKPERYGDRKNWEGYSDPTPYNALKKIRKAKGPRTVLDFYISEMLKATYKSGDRKLYRTALRISFYTLASFAEIKESRWEDISFDRNFWRIPAERTDRGYIRVIRLVPSVIKIFDRLKRESGGRDEDHVFIYNDEPLSYYVWQKISREVMQKAGPIASKGIYWLVNNMLFRKGWSKKQIHRALSGRLAMDMYNQNIMLNQWAAYLDSHRQGW